MKYPNCPFCGGKIIADRHLFTCSHHDIAPKFCLWNNDTEINWILFSINYHNKQYQLYMYDDQVEIWDYFNPGGLKLIALPATFNINPENVKQKLITYLTFS